MRRLGGWACACALVAGAIGTGGCTVNHKVEPIYVTVDINIKVQQQLDNFFDFEPNRSIVTELPGKKTTAEGGIQ